MAERRMRSYSAVSSFSECGEKFRLERVVKVPMPPAVYFAAGSAFHSTCDVIDKIHWDIEEWASDEAIREIWSEAFAREQAERNPDKREWKAGGRKSKHQPNGQDIAWWDEHGPEFAIKYRDWRKAHPEYELWELPGGFPAIEVEITTEMTGIPVKQYIDRVFVGTDTGALAIVDLKTSERPPAVPIQLADYRFGFERTFDVPVWYGAYYMAKQGKMLPPVDLSIWTPELVAKRYSDMDWIESQGNGEIPQARGHRLSP